MYYDEGLQKHAKNQVFTFQAQYPNAEITQTVCTEDDAIKALYNDSCEAIMISRPLSAEEKKVFESKKYFPKFSAVANSGVAIITNMATPLKQLSFNQVSQLLTKEFFINDSLGSKIKLRVLLDGNNTSVMRYFIDSLLKGEMFSEECNAIATTIKAINYVAENKNIIAFIDFAWLSDIDDSLVKANSNKIKFIPVSAKGKSEYFYPSQSTFKTGQYPFTRTIYVMRKTGDFTLAKGFESFVAGPKGQLTFLKQGLLPARQAERLIDVKVEPIEVK